MMNKYEINGKQFFSIVFFVVVVVAFRCSFLLSARIVSIVLHLHWNLFRCCLKVWSITYSALASLLYFEWSVSVCMCSSVCVCLFIYSFVIRFFFPVRILCLSLLSVSAACGRLYRTSVCVFVFLSFIPRIAYRYIYAQTI